jgi:hypothetical protein
MDSEYKMSPVDKKYKYTKNVVELRNELYENFNDNSIPLGWDAGTMGCHEDALLWIVWAQLNNHLLISPEGGKRT